MHILICDDDAAFGTRMAEYVAAYFAARFWYRLPSAPARGRRWKRRSWSCTSWRFWMWTCPA